MRTLVHVVTPEGADRRLVIDGDQFDEPDAGRVDREIDTSGLVALPGLADCHAHLGYDRVESLGTFTKEELGANARDHVWAQLEGGVLLVLDKGSESRITLGVLDAPPHARPELQMASMTIAAPGGYFEGFGLQVDEGGLVEAVGSVTGAGERWVKLIGDWPRRGKGAVTNFTEHALEVAVAVAHQAGCRVAIHTAAPRTASMAVRAGVDSIEHGLFLTHEDLEILAGRGGAWVPTIAAMEAIRDSLGEGSSGRRLFDEGLANVAELLPEAERLGVTVLGGSDLYLPHGSVAAEAERLVAYGLSPEAAVRALTVAAYEYAGVVHGLEPGTPADVVFVAGNPHDDVRRLQRPELVIRRGRIVRCRDRDRIGQAGA